MKLKSFIIIILTSFAIGCATEEVRIAESQAMMKSCCNSFGEMKFESIGVNTESRVKINKDSAFYAFDEGKSFFMAYSLPASKKTITVKSYYSLSDLIPGMFRPVVTMLDANYNKTRFMAPFVKQGIASESESYGYYNIDVRANEKYFIVHTDDDSYEDSFYHFYNPLKITKKGSCIDPRMAAVFGGVIGAITAANCSNRGIDIPHTVIGEISVKIN